MDKEILVIGGAGYIGSHMVRALLESRRRVAVFDDLSMGRRSLVPAGVPFIKGDLKKPADIRAAFRGRRIGAVMHFAASSLVGESVQDPLKYYENNVAAMGRLLTVMRERGVGKLVFSSTAAVFGEPRRVPIREDDPKDPTNPYGRSKLMIEQMLADVERAHGLRYMVLRYFNACGAHPSGRIGECHDPETHLIPNILKVLTGERKELKLFGDDFDTPDGTCVRDYVHVCDLADAHLRALRALEKGAASGVFNLGSGSGYSVLEIVRRTEKVTGLKVKVSRAPRRPGDPARLVASSARARRLLGWKPAYGLDEILSTAWNWERRRRPRR